MTINKATMKAIAAEAAKKEFNGITEVIPMGATIKELEAVASSAGIFYKTTATSVVVAFKVIDCIDIFWEMSLAGKARFRG